MKQAIDPENGRIEISTLELLAFGTIIFFAGITFAYGAYTIGLPVTIDRPLTDFGCAELLGRAELWFNAAANTTPVPNPYWASIANMYFNAYITGCFGT